MKNIKRNCVCLAGYPMGSWLFLLMFCMNTMYAKKIQQHDLSRDFMYRKSNFYFSIYPAFSPKPKITSFTNPYNFEVRLKGVMNFNLGMIYMYNFNKNIGISIGIYAALMSFKVVKFDYTIPGYVYSNLNLEPDYCFKCKELINQSTTFPIRFIYRKQITGKIDFVTSAGLNLELQRRFRYEFNDARGIIGKDTSSFLTFSAVMENEGVKRYRLIPYFGCSFGVNQLLKNNHYINYQFSANIPFLNPYKNGNFILLPNTVYEEHGNYKLNPMSFGLEINYVFTFNRKKLRKEQIPNHYFNSKKHNSTE